MFVYIICVLISCTVLTVIQSKALDSIEKGISIRDNKTATTITMMMIVMVMMTAVSVNGDGNNSSKKRKKNNSKNKNKTTTRANAQTIHLTRLLQSSFLHNEGSRPKWRISTIYHV